MANYIIAYRGMRPPKDEAEGRLLRGKFMDWLRGLGDNVVSPGNPLSGNKHVTPDGVTDDDSETRLVGYSVVRADDMETAVGYARACPHLLIGTVEVAEVTQMPMDDA